MTHKRLIELFDKEGSPLIPKKDCPLIVLSTHLTSRISFKIRQKTNGTYNHIMFLLEPSILASQDWFFEKALLSDYVGRGWKMKFWSMQDHFSKRALRKAIQDDLALPAWKRFYDLPGCIFQGIPGLKGIDIPFLFYCSERVPKIINDAYAVGAPNNATPADCNQHFKDNKNIYKYYGHYTFD